MFAVMLFCIFCSSLYFSSVKLGIILVEFEDAIDKDGQAYPLTQGTLIKLCSL